MEPRCMDCRQFPRLSGDASIRAFSLVEALVVIAVVGVLATIAIPTIGGILPSSSGAIATRNMNLLNAAVVSFNQNNHELALDPDSGTADEIAVIRSLQYVPPLISGSLISPSPGAPYFEPMANVLATSDSSRHRAQWNGRMYKLISPGTAGSGIDILRLAGRAAAAPSYPSGYQTVGAP